MHGTFWILTLCGATSRTPEANGFVCSVVLTDDRLLLPDRDEHKAMQCLQ